MDDPIIQTHTSDSVSDAVAKLEAALVRRQIQIFAVIDHGAGARSTGLVLHDEVLVIFGNPAVGTAIMQDDPRAGIDLPLRILLREDGGVTRIEYRDPRLLASAFDLTASVGTLARLAALLEELVDEIRSDS